MNSCITLKFNKFGIDLQTFASKALIDNCLTVSNRRGLQCEVKHYITCIEMAVHMPVFP